MQWTLNLFANELIKLLKICGENCAGIVFLTVLRYYFMNSNPSFSFGETCIV